MVVTYRDRLVRFGFDLIERIISRSGGQIVVLHQIETSPTDEPARDLRAILTVCSSRLHGLQSYKAKCFGRNIIIVNEAFTSKTAFLTGEMISNLGSKKIIKSGDLGFDRDVNASVAIWLRSLVDHPVAVHRNCYC